MIEELASMSSSLLPFSDGTPELAEIAAELAAGIRDAIESHICSQCHTHYGAETRWKCPCFAGFGTTDRI
jgi:hypothetical protein